MSVKEHQELNCWIAEHVMGWKRNKCIRPMPIKGEFFFHDKDGVICEWGIFGATVNFKPTTDPAASDELDDKILEKLGGDGEYYRCKSFGKEIVMSAVYHGENIHVTYPDKKVCRVLFAKKLFSK